MSLILHFPHAHDYLLFIDNKSIIPSSPTDSKIMNINEFFIVKILNPFFGLKNHEPAPPIVSGWMYSQIKKFGDNKSYLLNYRFPDDSIMSDKRMKKSMI